MILETTEAVTRIFSIKKVLLKFLLNSSKTSLLESLFSEAATEVFYWKKVFLEISQNLQENTASFLTKL